MKSIREWFEGTGEPLRSKLLARLHPAYADDQETSLYNALYQGFNWYGTPEGFDYWLGVSEAVEQECV
jgi:hypothetical protein